MRHCLAVRIAVAETLDPDGAMVRWASPDLMALGHQVLPLPTQELAPVLGAHGLAAWIQAVVEAFAPDLVIVCPPYDHAPASTWAMCRARGAKVVAFAMDEPLFAATRARPAVAAAYARALGAFDRIYVTAPDAAVDLAAHGVPSRWLRWALSPTSLAPPVALEPGFARRLASSAVLVGRPYARRVALLRALAQDVPVMVFGHGWDALDHATLGAVSVHRPLTGAAMHAVLAAAGGVITTGDWEAQPIAMVKVRLLEAAFAGAVQVAQRSPDLDAYFPADEVPRYDTVTDLAPLCRGLLADPEAARAAAAKAHARALCEHTWSERFAELAADLGLPLSGTGAPFTPPAAWRVGLAAAASDAERRGSTRLAAALYEASGDLMGEARTRLAFDLIGAARAAKAALAARDSDPSASVGLHARLPTPAPALGHLGFLDPTPELEALHLSALIASGDLAAAAAAIALLVARGDPERLVATASVLAPDAVPAHAALWRTLFAAALAAGPDLMDRALYGEHLERFGAQMSVVDTQRGVG